MIELDYLIIGLLSVVILQLWTARSRIDSTSAAPQTQRAQTGIVLDTSALLDGRIFTVHEDLGMGGEYLVPSNVLTELKSFADSNSDKYASQKKQSLAALDLLRRITAEYDDDYSELDADEQCVMLALKHRYMISSLDKNLVAAAKIKGVAVCNPDTLFVASSSNIYIGDVITVSVLGRSSKKKQAIAASEYGEVVFINDAVSYIGSEIRVTITKIVPHGHTRRVEAKVLSAASG